MMIEVLPFHMPVYNIGFDVHNSASFIFMSVVNSGIPNITQHPSLFKELLFKRVGSRKPESGLSSMPVIGNPDALRIIRYGLLSGCITTAMNLFLLQASDRR